MASQTCEKCDFSSYDNDRFDRHVESAPDGCLQHLRDRAIAAEARADAFMVMEKDMTEKFSHSVERIAQLLAPDAAKKLEKFVSDRGY